MCTNPLPVLAGFKPYLRDIPFSSIHQKPRSAMYGPSLAVLDVFVNVFILLAFRLSFDIRTISSTYYLLVLYVVQSQISDIPLRLKFI
jgi:hypothetical protein